DRLLPRRGVDDRVPVASRLAAAEVMRTHAGLHADQARRHVGKPCFDVATGPLLSQHDSAAPILADYMERVLTNIECRLLVCSIKGLGHGVLLVFSAPPSLMAAAAGARPYQPITVPSMCPRHDPSISAVELTAEQYCRL